MDSPAARRRLLVAAALLVVYLIWGSTYLGIAVAIETMPPLLMSSFRFLAAGAILYAVAIRLGDRAGDRPTPRQWGAAAVISVPLFLVGNGGVAWGEQHVPTGVAALIIAGVPLWLAVLDRLVYGQRLSPQAVAGLALGFGGIALLVDLDGGGGVDPVGALAVALAALGWAAGSLLARTAPLPRRIFVAVAMQMLAGGVAMGIAGLALGEAAQVDLGAVSARSLVAVGYLALFGSLLAFTCYAWLLRTARTSLVATYAYVNPVVAVLLGWAFYSEEPTWRTLVAGGVIVASVALIVSARARPRTAPTAAAAPARAR